MGKHHHLLGKILLLLGAMLAVFVLSTTGTYAKKADSYSIRDISKHVKKDSDIFSGATITNNVLTLIVTNDAAYDNITSFKSSQKVFMRDVKTALGKYKDNPLASNGILVTGANIKLDDGSKKPIFVTYYDKTALDTVDYSNAMNNIKQPLALLDNSTSYFIFKRFLTVNDAAGIFKNADPYDTDYAPDWFRSIVQGTVIPKPQK